MALRELAYRKTLLLVLGLTGLFSKFTVNLPTKWHTFIETFQVSTGVLHSRLSVVDPDIEKEYRELENSFERQLGLASFYSPDEIEEIKKQVEKVKIKP